jgi:hypothetical protein
MSTLGLVPSPICWQVLDTFDSALAQCAQRQDSTVESRRAMVRSLTRICTALPVDAAGDANSHVCASNLPRLLKIFLQGLGDYTVDTHGDIGSRIREASMTALELLLLHVSTAAPASSGLLTAALCEEVLAGLMEQCTSKIDRTRAHAGQVLWRLIHAEPLQQYQPAHLPALQAAFPKEAPVDWLAAADVFPLLTGLLHLPCYRFSLLSGLVCSIGGMTDSVARCSSASLVRHLQEAPGR